MTRLDDAIARLAARGYAWPIPFAIVEMIGRKEDCRPAAYRCPAGVPTIGWGEAEGINLSMRWSDDQCDARFHQQIVRRTRRVEALLGDDHANENQLGAMVSLAYNVGLGAFAKSTVLRQHKAGDFAAASRAFSLFNQARNRDTGKKEVSNGLTLRRAVESAMYLEPVEGAPAERTPQAVAEASPLSSSPIAQSGAVTVGVGALTGVSAVADQLDAAKGVLASAKGVLAQVSDFIGVSPVAMLAIALMVVGYIVIAQRRKQRAQGWA